MPNKHVDCDGHVMEVTDELISFVGEPFKTTGHMNPRRVLPSLDRFHTPRLEERKAGSAAATLRKAVRIARAGGLECAHRRTVE